MRIEDLIEKRWTKPEHLVYVIEKVRRSGMPYKERKALVEAWARRAGYTLEPWQTLEGMLSAPQEVA